MAEKRRIHSLNIIDFYTENGSHSFNAKYMLIGLIFNGRRAYLEKSVGMRAFLYSTGCLTSKLNF